MPYINNNTTEILNFCQAIKLYAKLIQFGCFFIKSSGEKKQKNKKLPPKCVPSSKSQVSQIIFKHALLVLFFWYIKYPAKNFQGHKSTVIKLILLLKRNKYFIAVLWAFVPFSLASRCCLVAIRHYVAEKCNRNNITVIEFRPTKLCHLLN